MISELIILSTGAIVAYKWEHIKLRLKWREIVFCHNKFLNKLGKRLKLWNITDLDSYTRLKVELPYGYTNDDLVNDLTIFKEGLHYDSIMLTNEYNMVFMDCIRDYKYLNYKPMKLEPYQLLVADNLGKPIIVNMNEFPHMLVGGNTGSGKSRLLLYMISNLIYSSKNIDLYLLQLRKGDLGVFKDCIQTKCYSKNIQQILKSLYNIDKECMRREELIDNTLGYYSIEDYNKKSGNKLNYIYVIVEEFSFLNISRGDCKEMKSIKGMCLQYIKNIINVGRASGVFLITSLQKPTNDSIPSDIKAQLCTRVSLFIEDEPTSRVILGDGFATKLDTREVVVRTLKTVQGYTYNIEHKDVMNTIKGSVYKGGNCISNSNNTPSLYKASSVTIINPVNINSDENDNMVCEQVDDSNSNDIRSILNEIDK